MINPPAAPSLWDLTATPTGRRGIYVAVSGNTGAGKSTLIQSVENGLRHAGHEAVGISERTFHHPFLTRMFADPGQYAFAIQVNFVLHRHLMLLRQMELGRIVIMERSHLDDELFLEEHFQAGHVTPEQRAAYRALAVEMNARVPPPDVMVLMNPEPELSIRRVTEAEELGHRPREFPSEEAKQRWIHRWYHLYVRYHAALPAMVDNDPRLAGTRLVTIDPGAAKDANATQVLRILSELAGT